MSLRALICCLLIYPLISTQVGLATERQRFDLQGGAISLELPTRWKPVKNFMYVPLTVLSPAQAGTRAVFSVTPLGLSSPDLSNLQRLKRQYDEDSQKWATQHGGAITRVFPIRQEKIGPHVEATVLSHEFKLVQNEYEEKSHYLKCKGKTFFVKATLRRDLAAVFSEEIERIIRSLDCD